MGGIEIGLILIGIICIVISLIFENSNKSGDKEELTLSKEQLDVINEKVTKLIDEQLSDLDEKTEITIEKISNKKIMEFTEYTDTVLAQVNRNHEESMFLYDMLNEKTKVVKRTINEFENAKADNEVSKIKEEALKEIPNEDVKEETKEKAKPKTTKRGRKPSKPKVPLTSNNNETILVLHKEGKSNLEIAKILGLGIGEVKLVIDLFTSDEE